MFNETFYKSLKEIAGESRIYTDPSDLVGYSRDMSVHSGIPDVIIIPSQVKDIQKIVLFANDKGIPITARGSGTSVTGAVLPVKGGIVLDMSEMKKIKEVNTTDHYVVVEPGVICGDLNDHLAPEFFFPPDPGSSKLATIGGMISTNASGLRAVKYGTTKDYVMAVEAILPTGEIVHTGHTVPKASAGYNLTQLLVSAEGTLGIITEATLRIVPMPQKIAFCLANFASIEEAGTAASEMLSSGLPLCACDIMDRISIDVVREKINLDLKDVESMLILEVDGHPAAVTSQLQQIEEICRKHNAISVHASDDPAERSNIWQARQGLVSALSRYRPENRIIPIAEDFGVPISKIPEAIKRAQAISKEYDILITTFGHAGDGNLHTTFIIDPKDAKDWEKVKILAYQLNNIAFDAGGTISAEHGIGLAKAPFIKRELGYSHEVMKKIKKLFDPANIMNPGKLGFDDEAVEVLDYFAFGQLPDKPEHIKSLGNKLADDESLLCVMCGFCREGCPAFAVLGVESYNARGRVQLAWALRSNIIEPTQELAEKFYVCTGCEACLTKCPSAVQVAKIVESVRRKNVEWGLQPESLTRIAKYTEDVGNIFGRPFSECKPIQSVHNNNNTKPDVLAFLGCRAACDDQGITPSLLKILNASGVNYNVYSGDSEEDVCCGFSLTFTGTEEALGKVVRRTADRIREIDPGVVVVSCSSCYKMLKKVYPEYVKDWNIKILHASDYIETLINSSMLKLNKNIALKAIYHDSCKLGRQTGIYDSPRNVIASIPGVELVEFPENRENSLCCGGGGGVPASNPKPAELMRQRRLFQAIEAKADIVVSACPTCKLQFTNAVAENPETKDNMKVMDIVELIAMAVD